MQNYWNPGRSCQVVINYCGSQGSVLQTDLHELRGLSRSISFQDLGSRATNPSTKGTDPITLSSACHPSAAATRSSRQAQCCCCSWKAGGQQGTVLAPKHSFPGQNNQPFCLSEFEHNSAVLEEGTAELCFWGRREESAFRCWGREQLLSNLTFVAGPQNISYAKKWQDVALDAREVRGISICGQLIVSPALGNPSFITK